MIKEGDRVLLGLSGGKDSLCMLHVLHELQQKAPIKFELACVTMDPQFPGFDPSPLIPCTCRSTTARRPPPAARRPPSTPAHRVAHSLVSSPAVTVTVASLADVEKLGIPYFFESKSLLEQAKTADPKSICAWCSRMKRGILYSCARRENYNVYGNRQPLRPHFGQLPSHFAALYLSHPPPVV